MPARCRIAELHSAARRAPHCRLGEFRPVGAFQERTNRERQPFGTLREHLAQLHASGLDGVFICFGPLPASAKQVGDERRPIWQVAGNGCPGKTPVQTWNARPPETQKGPDTLVE